MAPNLSAAVYPMNKTNIFAYKLPYCVRKQIDCGQE